MVGDGSYLMLNSEIATSVMLGHEARRRRARQPRLRLHQPAAAGVRRRAVQQPARRLRPGRRRRRRAIDFAAHARVARRARRERRGRSPSSRRRSRARARPTARTSIVHRHRSRAHDRRRRLVVGCRACPKCRRARRCARASVRARAQRAASVTKPATAAHAKRPVTMKPSFDVRIGINPISWSNDDLPSLGGETPLETALAEGKAIGYQGFELGNKFPREPEALRDVLARARPGAACRAGIRDGSRARSVDEEIAAVGPHLRAARRQRREGDGLRRSRRQHPGRARAAVQAAALLARRRSGARTASA